MTVFDWQAQQTEQAAKMLAHTLKHTEADRLAWKPSADAKSETRSAMEQVHECIRVNASVAARLQGGEAPAGGDAYPEDAEGAGRKLVQGASSLAEVIRRLRPEVLETMFPSPMGEFPGAFMISLPASNMMYHVGQINYIQTLYGDTEFRFPQD